MTDNEQLRAEACPRCGGLFEAHIHYIHCDAKPCPMASTKDTRTFLQMFADGESAGEKAK